LSLFGFFFGRGDMKSGSASAPSGGGGGGLAITERQKPAPSCVAALFQMFAKRKLFSSSSKKSKLLPPGEIATGLRTALFFLCANHFPLPLRVTMRIRRFSYVSFCFRCFSARTQVLSRATAGRRREDGGGQDEAPSGTLFSFSSSDFLGGETAIFSYALFSLPQSFFHSLSITSIFNRLHGILNVGKKITNYTV
jgi:hypothetical protein